MPKSFAALVLVATLTLAGCGAARAAHPAMQPAAGPAAQAKKTPDEADVRAFVTAWFALFDRNAPLAQYLPLLDDQDLEMRFPEGTLHNHAEFTTWYEGILRTIAKARHTLRTVEVERTSPGRFKVHVIVLWEATYTAGGDVSFLADQTWEVHEAGGRLRISRYLVSAAQP